MKRLKKTFAMVCVSALLLSGCSGTQADVPTNSTQPDTTPSATQTQQQNVQYLSAEKKLAIEAAWKAHTGDAFDQWYSEVDGKSEDGVRYYGTYGEVDVLFEPTFGEAITVQRIGGVMIQHSNTFELYAFADGKLYDLQDAFAEGLIDEEAMQTVARLHVQYDAHFTPIVLEKPEDTQMIEQMKLAFLDQFVKQDGYTTEDLSVVFYGDYDGAYVGFIDGIFAYTQALTSETVAGFTFHYVSGQTLLVFHDGQLMRLKEAYDQGILDVADLEELHSRFGGNSQEGEIR